ncbi:MAG: 16S rRNA (cytosine(1402)-N(4))-methyltransferase RsmH [Christensenellaceae bacterium]|nr:16S rRNA (cytosine(1402)-N(4))-methyltransferase RsmH [Christensenellaceae bacterium]MDD6927639.1 16S rRNA (cytosine(1402)-N(4))-methyltransferase RsmH [bacterium]
MEFHHIPIMLKECIEGLNIKPDGIYFDGTLGGGGHSEEILKRLDTGKLIATDLDDEALGYAKKRLRAYSDNFIPVKSNFKDFDKVLTSKGYGEIDGFLLDLGVSSYQLDNRDRGFSYLAEDTPLDMRMDESQELSAKTVVNEYTEGNLRYLISMYGEERFAANIAREIVARRQIKPIETTGELVKIIVDSIPKKFQHDGHPAKRTFQAIRIEVNGELDGLKDCIYGMVKRLKKGGRLAVITFHSLEDRIVKQCFKDLETACVCDKRLPMCVCGRKQIIETITKKPLVASEKEARENPRSKPAKLRIAEKL